MCLLAIRALSDKHSSRVANRSLEEFGLSILESLRVTEVVPELFISNNHIGRSIAEPIAISARATDVPSLDRPVIIFAPRLVVALLFTNRADEIAHIA